MIAISTHPGSRSKGSSLKAFNTYSEIPEVVIVIWSASMHSYHPNLRSKGHSLDTLSTFISRISNRGPISGHYQHTAVAYRCRKLRRGFSGQKAVPLWLSLWERRGLDLGRLIWWDEVQLVWIWVCCTFWGYGVAECVDPLSVPEAGVP